VDGRRGRHVGARHHAAATTAPAAVAPPRAPPAAAAARTAGILIVRIGHIAVRRRHVAVGVAAHGRIGTARGTGTASAPASLTRMRIVWCHSNSRTWVLHDLPIAWKPANLGGETVLYERPAGSLFKIAARKCGGEYAEARDEMQAGTGGRDDGMTGCKASVPFVIPSSRPPVLTKLCENAPCPHMPENILVVEYEPRYTDRVRQALAGQPFAPAFAKDGEEALRALDGEHPRLIVLSSVVPKVSTSELIRAIRGRDTLQQTPILLTVSGYNGKSPKQDAVRLGASDILPKPYSETEFLGKVQQMLGLRPAIASVAAE